MKQFADALNSIKSLYIYLFIGIKVISHNDMQLNVSSLIKVTMKIKHVHRPLSHIYINEIFSFGVFSHSQCGTSPLGRPFQSSK